ncbi:putative cytosol aminopeptidase 1 [Paraferrimonas haliotis]|uniref:Probable cytosol aminopeptidase n=2 Tax=Paraferrimonas haliotis TaxID=2013866 RepID=A0AA37TM96_9GAMM|nr:putative cytosol aminopeptidase 1 [Paraferrimonas haliotis]
MGLVATKALADNFNFVESSSAANHTVVVLQAGDKPSKTLAALDARTNQQITEALKIKSFNGAKKQMVELLVPQGLQAKRLIIMGVGDTASANKGAINELGAELTAYLAKGTNERERNHTITLLTAGISDANSNASFAAQFAHGMNLRAYRFDKYLKEKNPAPRNISVSVDDKQQAASQYQQLKAIEHGIFLARDLTNEVPSQLTPAQFAKEASKLKQLGVKVTIIKPKQVKSLGMGGLYSVGQGSNDGSHLVIAHWQGSEQAPIALIGKGITFDTGGYNIKANGDSISRMKTDMAGAAAVLGTIRALAEQKSTQNVVGIMAMAENMVSATATAPGDVITMGNGTTVEIVNTDAEGRLVMADALWYANQHFQPRVMVDIATLTGSKYRALGNRFTAIFSDDQGLMDGLSNAGERVHENLWPLPLAYHDELKSPIADIKNSGHNGPGATMGAVFLQHFAGDTKWAHLDMAGHALTRSDKGIHPTGGTGYGVRLLTEWIASNPE